MRKRERRGERARRAGDSRAESEKRRGRGRGFEENKCISNLLLSFGMTRFYLLHEQRKRNISDHQSKF